jgi:hypothetical protein
LSLAKKTEGRPPSQPLHLAELFGQFRWKAFNASGDPVKLLATDSGILKYQLTLIDSGAVERIALSETDGTQAFSNYGKAGGSLTAFKVETTGEQDIVLHGKDSGGVIDPLRTNDDQQLQVEVIESGTGIVGVTAQSAPGASTETVLYTVPASTKSKILGINIANRGNSSSFRVGFSIGGGALATADYIFFDTILGKNASLLWELSNSPELAAADEIRVLGTTANFSFSAFIEERAV